MKKILIATLCVLGLVWSIANVQAATINLNFTNSNAENLLGTVSPGSPNDIGSQTIYLNQLLSMDANSSVILNYGNSTGTQAYVRSSLSNSNLPSTCKLYAVTANTSAGPLINIDSADYIVANYGNQNAVWYVGNLAAADSVQIPTNLGQNVISNVTTWANFNGNIAANTTTSNTANTATNSAITTGGTATAGVATNTNGNAPNGNNTQVPEPGTILLLGLGFLSLVGLRRIFNYNKI